MRSYLFLIVFISIGNNSNIWNKFICTHLAKSAHHHYISCIDRNSCMDSEANKKIILIVIFNFKRWEISICDILASGTIAADITMFVCFVFRFDSSCACDHTRYCNRSHTFHIHLYKVSQLSRWYTIQAKPLPAHYQKPNLNFFEKLMTQYFSE